jgi:uncharacterized protein YcfL
MIRTRSLIAGALLALMLAGCGSSTKVVQPNVNVSIGQQLIDLKNAKDSGALSESEYKKQKQALIDNFKG